jgi:hypothetical protein
MLLSELTVDMLTKIGSLVYYTAGKPILQEKDVN